MRLLKVFFGSFLLTMILFSSYACQKKSKKHNKHKTDTQTVVYDTSMQKGIILPDVKCRADSTISFALYLPLHYSTSKNWPVIFIFDAQARGKLPLDLYKDLAEKYGYILIGSNNSKNRVDWTVNKEEIRKLIDDAFGRFAIDQQRVYTMGFSGGARVACLVAMDLAKIQGVIGCAAGFPQFDKPLGNSFCYIGFSGDVDFNRVEMIRLDESLASSGWPYFISYYQGKHDWPAIDIMKEGFLWIEFNAYKSNLSARKESLITDFKKQIDDESAKAKKTENTWGLYSSLKKGFTFLNGLTDVSAYSNEMAAMDQSDNLKNIKTEKKKIIEQEISKQEEYRNALNKSSMDWWKKEVSVLNKRAGNTNNADESVLAKRLLNYISLMSNMSVNNTLSSNQPETTLFFLTLYGMVDPKNPDYFFLSGYFFAKQGNKEKSVKFLKNAVKYGYKDKKKLLTDPIFDILRKNPAFDEIVNSIVN